MAWGSAAKAATKTGGSSFANLKNTGDSVRCIVHPTEPLERFRVRKTVEACGPDHPEAQRVLGILLYDVDAKAVQIWDIPDWRANTLFDAVEKHGLGAVYQIVRTGMAKNTDYKVTKAGSASAETLAAVTAAELPDYARFGFAPVADATDDNPAETPAEDPEDVPF